MTAPRKPSPTPDYDGGQRVYSGRVELGAVYSVDAAYLAVNSNGERLGSFPTRSQAIGAVLEAAPRPKKGGVP